MLRKLRPDSIYDVMAAIACCGVLAGGTAYAANTVRSSDIVDGEVGSADVKDNSINTFDVHSFIGEDVIDGTLTGGDIANESIGVADIGSQAVGPDEVINDSLLQSDIRAGAVTGDEVLDFSLGNGDLLTGSVDTRAATNESLQAEDIKNGSLNDDDIGQSTLVNVTKSIGFVPAHLCKDGGAFSSIDANGDHLLLTPSRLDANLDLIYSAEFGASTGSAFIKVCNPTASSIDDGNTSFNLLVIDAQ